jgi:hypothetical protein
MMPVVIAHARNLSIITSRLISHAGISNNRLWYVATSKRILALKASPSTMTLRTPKSETNDRAATRQKTKRSNPPTTSRVIHEHRTVVGCMYRQIVLHPNFVVWTIYRTSTTQQHPSPFLHV